MSGPTSGPGRVHRAKIALYPMFFLSGAAGLVFQVIWVRQLGLLLGNTTEAVTSVLAAFMLGLSAGSAVAARLGDRVARPIACYGAIEVSIGITAVLVTLVLSAAGPLYRALAVSPLGASEALFPWVRFAFACAAIAVPAGFMGATLPVLARRAIARLGVVGEEVGRLYALNTFGAAVGCLVAGFAALGALGIQRTALVAGAINVVLGLGAWRLSRWAGERRGSDDAGVGPVDVAAADAVVPGALRPSPPSPSPSIDVLLWITVAASGFAGLGYEVVWTRVLVFVLGSSAYAFALMLGIFLVGLAFGGLWISPLADRSRRPLVWLAALELAVAASVLVCLLLFPEAIDVLRGVAAPSITGRLATEVAKGLALMGLPTFFLGAVLPLATRLAVDSLGLVARRVGGLYAVNTLGSIAGALAAGFVLLPVLGTERTTIALALLNGTLGVALLARVEAAGASVVPRRAVLAATMLVVLAMASGLAGRLERLFVTPEARLEADHELVHFDEGRNATVTVFRDLGYRNHGALRLYTNGSAMTGTTFVGRRYMGLLGHLPVLAAPDPRRSVTICFGTGMTFGATAIHPEIEDAVAVELSQTVIEASPLFDEANHHVMQRANASVEVEDGRQELLTTSRRFDVITAEPPPPHQAGTYQLYSVEFYRLAADRLEPGGVVAQWLPHHDQSELETRMVARTFLEVFPHASLWLPTATEGILIGSLDPVDLDASRLAARIGDGEVADALERIGVPSAESLLATLVLDAQGLERWAGPAPIITDDQPVSDFYLAMPPDMEAADMRRVLAHALSPRDVVDRAGLTPGTPAAVRLERAVLAHRAYLDGVVANVRARIQEAVELAPDNRFYRATLSLLPEQHAELDRAIAAAPGRLDLAFTKARTLLNAHRAADAAALLADVTERAAAVPMAWFNRAVAEEEAGELERARSSLAEATARDPRLEPAAAVRRRSLAALEALGAGRLEAPAEVVAALVDGGRWPEALEAASRWAGASPGDADAWLALGRLLVRVGEMDEAIPYLERALRAGAPDARPELARAWLDTGHPEAALELVARADTGPALDPAAAAYLELRALRELGRFEEARAALGRARELGVPERELAEDAAAIRFGTMRSLQGRTRRGS